MLEYRGKNMRNTAAIGLIISLTTSAFAAPLATVLGRPDATQEFVSRLIKSKISLLESDDYEADFSTGLYSILAGQGITETISIEVMPSNGGVSFGRGLEAVRAAGLSGAPVVFWILRGETGYNEPLCREMASFPEVAFVFPSGSDGQGEALNPQSEPHCLAKNILFVTAFDEEAGELAPFSNYGQGVRLAAPGVDIAMTGAGGNQYKRTGVTPALAFAAAQLSVYERTHANLRGAALFESFLENGTRSLPALLERVEGGHAIVLNTQRDLGH
jgi:hypothetical protein